MRKGMLIGALANATGVGVETIRFYEREGLLPQPPRGTTGYRRYDANAARRVRFILKAKELGFTLAETKELLDLRVVDSAACDDVTAKAQQKIEAVESRIQELKRVHSALQRLVQACATKESTSDCPILEALDEEHDPKRKGNAS